MLRPSAIGLLLFVLGPSAAALQARRLNEALPLGQTAGTVSQFQLTADETHALYLADPDVPGRVALLSVALAGPISPDQISDPQVEDISGFSLGQNGERVVYAGSRGGTFGLFSTRVDGSSASLRLTSAQPSRFQVDPSGTRVVFTTLTAEAGWEIRTAPIDRVSPELTIARFLNQDVDFVFLPDGSRIVYVAADHRLYSAPSDASAGPILLTPGAGALLQGFRLGPDGARAVYPLDLGGIAVQLWSVRTDGSASPVRLDSPPASNRKVSSFALGPDGQQVAFLEDRDVAHRDDLFVVPIGGGANTRLYTPVDATDSVSTLSFTADGSRVLFTPRPSAGTTPILAAPADGSAAPAVLVQVDSLVQYAMTPDGARLVFTRRANVNGAAELFSTLANGSAAPVLLDASTLGVFTLAPVGTRVLYRPRFGNDLFSAPVGGGSSPVRLNAPGASVQLDFELSAAGRVLFRAAQQTTSVVELFDVAVDASTGPRKLNSALALAVVGDVSAFRATEEAAFFVADQERDDVNELYRVSLEPFELVGPRRVTRLSPPLGAGGDVESDFTLSSNGRWLIYRSDQEENEKRELYALRADGRSSPAKISGSMQGFSDVGNSAFAPDGTRVVFLADSDVDGEVELFSVDSSAVPLRLNSTLVAGGRVTNFEITPDSRRVVYRGELLTDGVHELFSAPIDAGGGQVRLHGPLPPGGRVIEFHLSPDGTRVAFSGNLVTSQTELFAAPVDGSGPAVGLIQNVTTRTVRDFGYTADGTRLVFWAGQANNARLYSVRGDGSELPVLLGGLENIEFALPAAGPWVVFSSGAGLFSTRVDGSQSPIPLTTTLASQRRFVITPDATRVVFSSFSSGVSVAPIDGSAPARQLDGRGTHVDEFGFSTDGETVLFRNLILLIAVPLDGSRAGELVSGQPILGGGAGQFQALSRGRVVFGGDLEVNDVQELWLAILGGGPHARKR